MTFRPGETGTRILSRPGTSFSGPAANPNVFATSQPYFGETRPLYGKGAVSHVGSTLWRSPTPYSHCSRTVYTPGKAYIRGFLSGGLDWTYGATNPDVWTFLGSGTDLLWNNYNTTNAQNAAKTKALRSIAGQKAGIGEDLATYAQTVRMFGGKSALLRDLLYAVKRGRLKKYLNHTYRDIRNMGDKKLAQAYLEFVYGWQPLVSDIYGTYQLLKQYASGAKPVIIHGHGSQREKSSYQKQFSNGSYTCLATVNTDATARCDIYARVDPQLVAFRMLNQLGLLNPLSLAWEITPWSFVVDWFIPIGPVLDAFTAPVGLNFISGTIGSRISRTIEGPFHNVRAANMDIREDVPIDMRIVDEGYGRSVLSTWPFPSPYLNLNPLSGDRWLKALALSIVNLRR